MEEMNKKQEIDIANLQNEVKKIEMEFQVEVMKIQAASQTAEMTAKVQLQTSLQAASQTQTEPAEAPEAPEPSAPPIVINNIIPPQASKKRVTLSGPLENRVGIVEDVNEPESMSEDAGEPGEE
jgi:Skp family chaperone for outer membrane proteins